MISTAAIKSAGASNSSSPTTSSTASAPSASAATAAGNTGGRADSGAFDALLALQALFENAPVCMAPEGLPTDAAAEVHPADDAGDDKADDPSTDALAFLAALLPAPIAMTAGSTAGDGSALAGGDAGSPDGHAAAAPAAAPIGTAAATAAPAPASTELPAGFFKAFEAAVSVSVSADSKTKDSALAGVSASNPATGAGSTGFDTNALTVMAGTAELLAHGARHGVADRGETNTLNTPVRDPRWADELGARVASMVRTGESSASLQLSPADLGPLEINVSVRDQQATIHFGAAHAETRALLEASMPRLRDMLASQGFSLTDSSVSQGFARQARHETRSQTQVDSISDVSSRPVRTIHIAGLLDTYA